MTLPIDLVQNLAGAVASELTQATVGHCVRIDNLSRDDCLTFAGALRATTGDFTAAVLTTDTPDGFSISSEQAVEIRNKKSTRLCLLVPADLGESSNSSLGNAFASYDLARQVERYIAATMGGLPAEVRDLAKTAIAMHRGPTRPNLEDIAAYLSAVAGAPSLEVAGRELARLCLLPDWEPEGITGRLADNARCARQLVRPSRPQMSPDERLTAIGLRQGAVRDGVARLLQGRSLRDWRTWLSDLARDENRAISFHLWALDTEKPSDLESIEVQPFLMPDGTVEKWSGLMQPNGKGTEPTATVGPQAKVTVRWKSVPKNPAGLHRWRLRLISTEDERLHPDRSSADLPEVTIPASRKSGSIALDLDLETVGVRAVQIEITGLDEFQSELRDAKNERIAALSDEFWLDDRTLPGVIDPVSTQRQTVANLPLGRLKFAVEARPESIEPGAGTWVERDLNYYSVTLNGRRASAVAMSPTLRALEERVLHDPTSLANFDARVSASESLDPVFGVHLRSEQAAKGHKAWESFIARRRDLFRAIRANETGLVETTQWTPELTSLARSYARSYRALLSELEPGSEGQRLALRADSVSLDVDTGVRVERAVVTLPTHPLRILWFAAYAELLASWEGPVLEAGKAGGDLLDLALLERVTPINVPAFSTDGTDVLPFTGNLRFFWGIATPVGSDAGRLAALVAGALGLPDAEVALADIPPSSIARELRSYLELHPYVETLHLRVDNAGSGEFTADALKQLYEDPEEPDAEGVTPRVPRLDLTMALQPPIPTELAPVSRLRSEVYMARPSSRHSPLHPHFSYAITPRRANGDHRIPQNVTLLVDSVTPTVVAAEEGTADSASFYGLLVRFASTYSSTSAGATWIHTVNLPRRSARQTHPVTPNLTGELADLHRELLVAMGKRLGGPDGAVPSVQVVVGPEERHGISQIHANSDWVLTLDRFLGPELFDDPSDLGLSQVARTYLLDYGPEFLDGLGHRLMVTTSQRAEIVSILTKAMIELGFGLVEQSVGDVLGYLKMVSGRLALRVVGNDAHAREAVSLGVVASYLRSKRQLQNSILVPVDAHPELFGPAARRGTEPRLRCDLLKVRFVSGRMECTFIEVKSRSAAANSEELMHRIVDQIEATEQVVRDLFFRHERPRLDRTLQRSRLAAILRFYLARSKRYSLLTGEDVADQLAASIERLESGIPELKVERLGFVVNLHAPTQQPVVLRDTTIRFLNAADLATAGFSSVADSDTVRREPAVDVLEVAAAASDDGRPAAPGRMDPGTQAAPVEDAAEEAAPPSDPGRRTVTEPDGTAAPAGPVEPEGLEAEVVLPAGAVEEGETASSDRSELEEDTRDAEPPSEPSGADLEQPPPVETSRGVRIGLGATVGDGDEVAWTPSVRGSPHLFVLGIPGQGKSWTVSRLLDGLISQGVPAIVFDFHGQFAGAGGLEPASGLPVVQARDGMPFSPFETDAAAGSGQGSWRLESYAIAEILQYVCDLGEIQQDLVFQAIRDSYQAAGWGGSAGPGRLPTVSQVRDRIEELEAELKVRNVSARCRPVLEFGLFRDDVRAGSFEAILRHGAVIDVHDLGLESLQLAAGAFLMRRIYKEMFAWGETTELRLALVLDEAHRLARDVTLPKLMKEGRKFGILVVVASQGLADFHPEVVGNAGTKVVYRTNFPMSKRVAGYLRAAKGVDLAATIEQLAVGEAYVQTPEMPTAARVRMYPVTSHSEG